MNKKLLKWISGEPGTGKGNHIKKTISENPEIKVLIVQPTTELIDEFSKYIPDCKVLHSKKDIPNLFEEINKTLSSTETKVLFITDKMYYKIDVFRLRKWKVFIDDCVDFCQVISTNKSNKDNFEGVLPSIFSAGDFLEIDGEGTDLDNSYLNYKLCGRDDVSDPIKPFWDQISSLNQFHRKAIYKKSFDSDFNKIVAFGDYNIAQYTDIELNLDITYLANNFEGTLLYKANKDMFEASPTEYNKTYDSANNSRITMHYFIDNPKFQNSKHYMSNNVDIINKVQQFLLKELRTKDYIWTTNNQNVDFSLDGIHLTPNQRGSNKYMDYDNAVFMAVMRPSKDLLPHYDDIWNITESDLIGQWTIEILNQFIYRGVIRNYQSRKEMNVWVLDRNTAYNITGCTYKFHDIGIEEKENGAGRPEGTVKYPDEHKSLDRSFRSWKSTNLKKTNVRELFAKWRANVEKKFCNEDVLEQLNRYQDIINKNSNSTTI